MHRLPLALLSLLCVAGQATAQCDQWLPTPGDSSLRTVNTLAVADHDQSGPLPPVLYAAGTSYLTGALWAWDGLKWSAIPGLSNSPPTALFTLDRDAGGLAAGTLLLGGTFTFNGGAARCIAAWNGSTLSPIGPSASSDFGISSLRCFTTWDPDGPGPAQPWIIVGGQFTRVGGIAATSFAAWDGTSWRTLNTGFAEPPNAMVSFDPDGDGPALPLLIAGTMSGVVQAWNGSAWSVMGPAFGAQVTGVATFDPDGAAPLPPLLYASSLAGSPPWAPLAVWNGSAWAAAGANTPGFNGGVQGLAALDLDGPGPNGPTLVATGSFSPVFSDASRPSVALLTEGGWVMPYGSPDNGGSIRAAVVIDPDGPSGPRGLELVVAGASNRVGGARGTNYTCLGAWNGSRWGPLGNEFTGRGIASAAYSRIFDFQWHDDDGPGPNPPALYACGSFTAAGGELAEGLARWDGSRFVGMGTPRLTTDSPRSIYRLTSFDPDGDGPQTPWLVGADITVAANRFVRWSNNTWTTIGTGTASQAAHVRSFDPDGAGFASPLLFGAGNSIFPSNVGLARWNGSTWAIPGTRRNNAHYVLFPNGPEEPDPEAPALYALSLSELLRWNGSDFTLVASVFVENNLRVPEALWWDSDANGPMPGEVVIGAFQTAVGGPGMYTAAAFNGTTWRQVGNTLFTVCNGLGQFDPDSGGPIPAQLILGTDGDTPGLARRLADGVWTTFAQGFESRDTIDPALRRVNAFITIDPDDAGPLPPELWIGGIFTHAGGIPAANFARWRYATLPPAFVTFPSGAQTCVGTPASLTADALHHTTRSWQVQNPAFPGGWQALADGNLVIDAQTIATISGSATESVTITPATGFGARTFRCVLSNACQTATSNAVAFTANDCPPPCDPDLNQDGNADQDDLAYLVNVVGGGPNPTNIDPDFNRDGNADQDDVAALINVIAGGPCP
jgi:hypothetical protein